MKIPLVSVLMTAYNREKYIGEAIESVMASTYQNWELIIVDDCSSDKTVEIARSYEAKDSRIKVYINEENLGDYPNRNRAASYAKGKYLKYVDADDMIYPHGLEIIVQNMEKFPEAGWGIMSQKQFNHMPYPLLIECKEIYRTHYILKRPILNRSPLSAVISRELFEKEGGFANVRHYGDAELWHRLALKYDLVAMQDGLVWWRGHGEQESSKRFSKVNLLIESTNMVLSSLDSDLCPLNSIEKNTVIKSINKKRTSYGVQLLKKGEFLLWLSLFKKQLFR